jgi:hypothetical protein
MSLEVTFNGSIEYDDDLVIDQTSVANRQLTSAGKRMTHLVQNVGTSEEAIQLGEVTAPGAYFFKNLDPTNYIEIKSGTGGTVIAKLMPDTNGDGKGGFCMGDRLGSGAQAPYAIANAAACRMEVFIVDT